MSFYEIAPLVASYVCIRDVFVLRMALGRDDTWMNDDVARMLCQKMGLRHTRVVSDLVLRMRIRCWDCGVPTRRVPRLCAHCTKRWMLTRSQINWINTARPQPLRNIREHIRSRLVPCKRDRVGRLYYWRRDVQTLW